MLYLWNILFISIFSILSTHGHVWVQSFCAKITKERFFQNKIALFPFLARNFFEDPWFLALGEGIGYWTLGEGHPPHPPPRPCVIMSVKIFCCLFKLPAFLNSKYCMVQFFSKKNKNAPKSWILCMFNFLFFLHKKEIPKFCVSWTYGFIVPPLPRSRMTRFDIFRSNKEERKQNKRKRTPWSWSCPGKSPTWSRTTRALKATTGTANCFFALLLRSFAPTQVKRKYILN